MAKIPKTSPEEWERQRRNRERLMDVVERRLARSEGREPRPLPQTDAEYRTWRKPHEANLERVMRRLRAKLGEPE